MLRKRGQLTSFIVLGIVIVILVGVILLSHLERFREAAMTEEEKQVELPPEAAAIRSQIRDCLEDVSVEGLYHIGLHGGFVEVPEGSLAVDSLEVAYAATKKTRRLPSLENIAEELELFLEDSLEVCLPDELLAQGFVSRTAEVTLRPAERLFLTLDFPSRITLRGTEFVLKEPYEFEVPIRLGKLHALAMEIVESAVQHPGEVDLGSILNQEILVDITIIDPSTLLYSLRDEQSSILGIPYTFNVAVRS